MNRDPFDAFLASARRGARQHARDGLPFAAETRVLAAFREVVRQREDGAWIWGSMLRGAWLCLAAVSLPVMLWAATQEAPRPPSVLEMLVRVEPLPPFSF